MHLMRWPRQTQTFPAFGALAAFVRNHLSRRADHVGRIGGVFTQWVTGPDGSVLVPAVVRHNTLTNEGANWVRDIMFKVGTAPGSNALYIGLFLDSATPSVSTTLASGPTGEASGNGYSRKNVTTANWNSATQGQANNNASPVTYTASGGTLGGGAVNEAFVCNAASGTSGYVLCYATQSGGPFTVASGSSLNTTYSWTIS